MHSHSPGRWTHDHVFLGPSHSRNERRTWWVVGITAAMMVGEIVGGAVFGSMALLADGWHMATHAAALGISGLAYMFARKHAHSRRFAFGTGKFGDLAGFASAIILALIAVQIAYESAVRFVHPVPIAYTEAIAIAIVGLVVNLVCAWLLGDHGDAHGHSDHEGHDHHHQDNNLRAAFVHVVADAATSVLAIMALFAAMMGGWRWADSAVGVVGSVVIATWAYRLIRDSGAILLDIAPNRSVEALIRERLETGGDRVTDLHVWQVGPGHRAAIVSLVSDHPEAPSDYKNRLAGVPHLSHVTVEVERCPHHAQVA